MGATLLMTCVVLVFLTLNPAGERRSDLRRRPSTIFTDQGGTRAFYLTAERFLPSVERWRWPLRRLEDRSEDFSTLVVAKPNRPLSAREVERLDDWVEAGGQLILASFDDWPIRAKKRSFSSQKPSEDEESSSETPSDEIGAGESLVEGTSRNRGYLAHLGIKVLPRGEFGAEDDIETYFGSEATLTLASETEIEGIKPFLKEEGNLLVGVHRLGEGRVLFVPDPLFYSNARLAHSPNNAVWLIQTAAAWGNGGLAFDEYALGFPSDRRRLSTMVGLFLRTPYGWVCLQAALALALFLLIYRRRFGALKEAPPVVRSSPLELVEARAALFRAAEARRLAADQIHRHLQLRLSARLGYNLDIDSKEARLRLSEEKSPRGEAAARYLDRRDRTAQAKSLSEADLSGLARDAGRIIEEQPTL